MIYRIQPLCDFSSSQMLINGHLHLFHLCNWHDRCSQFIMLLVKVHISRALISPVDCTDLDLDSPDYKISSDKQFPYSIYCGDCERRAEILKINNLFFTLLKEDGISLKLKLKWITLWELLKYVAEFFYNKAIKAGFWPFWSGRILTAPVGDQRERQHSLMTSNKAVFSPLCVQSSYNVLRSRLIKS